MSKSETFKPKSDFVWGSVALSFCGLFLLQAAVYPLGGWLDLVIGITLLLISYLVWFRPKLVLRDNDLVVVNPLRSHVIAYGDITDLETRWALRISHANGHTRVWVAPASGKQRWISDSTTKWSSERLPTNDPKTMGFTSMSKSHFSDSGAAARLIEQRLKSKH